MLHLPDALTQRYHSDIVATTVTAIPCSNSECRNRHISFREDLPGFFTLLDNEQPRSAFHVKEIAHDRFSFTGVMGHYAQPPRSDEDEPNYLELTSIFTPSVEAAVAGVLAMYSAFGSEEGCQDLFAAHGYILADAEDKRAAVGLIAPISRERIPAPRLAWVENEPWITHRGVEIYQVADTSLWFTPCKECYLDHLRRRNRRIRPHDFDIRALPNAAGYDLESLSHSIWFNRDAESTRTTLEQITVIRDAINAGILTALGHDAPALESLHDAKEQPINLSPQKTRRRALNTARDVFVDGEGTPH